MANNENQIKDIHIKAVKGSLEDKRTINFLGKIKEPSFFNNFTYYKLKTIYNAVETLYYDIKETWKKVQLENIGLDVLDIDQLYKLYKQKGLNKLYPDLDLDRLKELYDNPPESLKSPAYKKHIIYDKIIVRKYIIAVIQMIFNQMDLVVTFCGREGTGKTTASTQDAYLVYYILTEIKMIKYDFTLNNIMNYNLKQVTDNFNKYSQQPFRIFILDEGNELNRKEWSNPLVSLFFQKLRRERKHLRIIFINLPQLGELMPSITLSRVNFVFQLSMAEDLNNKLATKGKCYFYIIPRFSRIYSYLNKKILYQDIIINDFGKILDDKKKYLQTLPKYLAIHKFKRNGVWAFNESDYDARSKLANESFSNIGVTLTKSEIFYLAKHLDLKKLEIKPKTKAYYHLASLKNKKIGYAISNDNSIALIGELDRDDEET